MANEVKSNTAPAKSNLPLLIIGAVLIGALIGGAIYYNSARTTASSVANKSNTNAANKTADTKNGIPPNAPVGAQPPNAVGSQNASVVLEEFADFQCGSCAAAHPVMTEIKSLYGSRIRFIYRNYPLSIPAHDKAYEASVAAEAAGLQGKFWDMQNQLFSNQQAWTAAPSYKQIWKGYAEKVGMDVAKWENDMAGMVAKQRVNDDLARGKAAGVNSTPTLYVNGAAIPYTEMTVPKLKAIIEAELQKAPAGTAAAPAAAAPAGAAPAANAGK